MSALSGYEFKADVAAFARILDINLQTIVRMFVLKIWNGVTQKTPVDTGRARAGWAIIEGTPDAPVPPEGQYGPPPPAKIEVVDGKRVVYVINAVEYVNWLEEGSSQQAPAGMVRVTLAELEREIESIIKAAA